MNSGAFTPQLTVAPLGLAMLESLTVWDSSSKKLTPAGDAFPDNDQRIVPGVGDGELWELLCTLHFAKCRTSGVSYSELVLLWYHHRPLCSLHEYAERLFEQGLLQHPTLSAEEAVKEFDRVREIVVGSDLPNDITRKWR